MSEPWRQPAYDSAREGRPSLPTPPRPAGRRPLPKPPSNRPLPSVTPGTAGPSRTPSQTYSATPEPTLSTNHSELSRRISGLDWTEYAGLRSDHRVRHIPHSDIHSLYSPSIIERPISQSWAEQTREPADWVERKLTVHRGEEEDDEDWEEEPEVNEIRFFQPAFLSEAAVQLRDRVERRRHLKAGIAWVGSFTGRDIVVS